MKKNKSIFTILAGLMSVALLGGCTIFNPPTPEPPTPEPPDPPITTPLKEDFTKYFQSSFDVTFLESKNSYKDQNNATVSFQALLDRQIDVFTQDIIYRLTTVYGYGAANVNVGVGSYNEPSFVLFDPVTATDYAYQSKKAMVSNYNVLKNVQTVTSGSPVYLYSNNTEVKNGSSAVNNPDITQVASYAYALSGGTWANNLTLTHQFNFKHALNGGFSFNNGFTTNLNTATAWRLKNSAALLASDDRFDATVVYSDFVKENFATMKLAVANILAGSTTGSGYTYLNALNAIDHLGFNSTDKANLLNYIKNNVIGSTVYNADASKKPSVTQITPSNVLTTAQHEYKAYELLIPAMLDQAMNNTFLGTNVSLWLTVLKNEARTAEMDYKYLSSKNFTSLKLKPKNSIPLTKLVMMVSGVSPSNIDINYSIYRTNTSSLVQNKTVAKSSSTTIMLDFSAYSTYSLASDGYILINISNSAQTPYSIVLDGYYNKV